MMPLHTFFSYYHSQTAFVLTYEKSFLNDLDSHQKNRDVHIEVFFVDSIYSKPMVIRKN